MDSIAVNHLSLYDGVWLVQNMLKILGISDKVLWLSWYLFFIFYNLPVLVTVAAVSKYFAFTLSEFWLILTLLLLALLASISYALFITALFTDGNLAGAKRLQAPHTYSGRPLMVES